MKRDNLRIVKEIHCTVLINGSYLENSMVFSTHLPFHFPPPKKGKREHRNLGRGSFWFHNRSNTTKVNKKINRIVTLGLKIRSTPISNIHILANFPFFLFKTGFAISFSFLLLFFFFRREEKRGKK